MAASARADAVDKIANSDQAMAEVARLATPAAMRGALADSRAAVPTWHVVRNVHENEQMARACLQRSGFEVYYPQLIVMKPKPFRKLSLAQRKSNVKILESVRVPLFPRYVFVRFSRASNWQEIFGALGLLGILCDGDDHKPCPFPEAIIEALRACADANGNIQGRTTVQELAFAIGQQVKVVDGPFAGFPGTVQEAVALKLADLDDSRKLQLLVSLFGRQVPVELPVTAVEVF